MANPDTDTPAPNKVTVPADLSPADADKLRTQAIDAIAAARAAGQPLEMALDAERAAPCAVQMLVATQRSADAAGVELSVPAATVTVLSEMGIEMKGVS